MTQPLASQPASQAGSQGVFSTMMAASKQKSKGAALSASDATALMASCCRSQEEALLARVFASVLPPAAPSGVNTQRLQEGCSQAQCVSPRRSLWVCAGRSDPPGCRLQERVQKRKAEAAMQAEAVKKQHAQQMHQCSAPEQLPSCHAEVQHVSLLEPCSMDNPERLPHPGSSAEAADCIILDSVQDDACGKLIEGKCMLSQPAQCVLQQASARTMDPVKRMRLQALQQELKAARQTVTDLERMIKAEELG